MPPAPTTGSVVLVARTHSPQYPTGATTGNTPPHTQPTTAHQGQPAHTLTTAPTKHPTAHTTNRTLNRALMPLSRLSIRPTAPLYPTPTVNCARREQRLPWKLLVRAGYED